MSRLPAWAILVMAVFCQILPCAPAMAQGTPAQSTARSSFTEAQRREIIDIIRRALRTDPTILRDAVTALQAENSRSESAAAAAAAATAAAAIAQNAEALTRTPGDPVGGNPDGDVTMVEFYDIRCPYCRRMMPAEAELLKSDPKLRVVYKDIPILGPGSVIAARAVLAAQRQGAYLRLRDALMTGPGQIDAGVVQAAAQHLGLDWERLQRDMADPAIQGRLEANLRLAHALDLQGTPAYVIGRDLLPGAVPLTDLREAVAQARGH